MIRSLRVRSFFCIATRDVANFILGILRDVKTNYNKKNKDEKKKKKNRNNKKNKDNHNQKKEKKNRNNKKSNTYGTILTATRLVEPFFVVSIWLGALFKKRC
jgi:predicted histidine transporter YuiF (NhaC family)